MRVSRQWRYLQVMKRFGFGHDTDKTPGNGELAEFCPACPQPGFNIEPEWRPPAEQLVMKFLNVSSLFTSFPSYWVRRRVLVTDGNFKADHMKMRQPDSDVTLMDGEGYFVESAPYKDHLKKFTDVKQACLDFNKNSVFNLTLSITEKHL